MARKSTTENRLTEEKKAELLAEIKAQGENVDREALAKKYGVVVNTIAYHERRVTGRLAPSERPKQKEIPNLEAINADIDAGMSEREIASKYDLSNGAVQRMKERMKMPNHERAVASNGHGSSNGTVMSAATLDRIIGILRRLAIAHPKAFADVNPLTKIAKKYPNLLAEVL